MATNRDGLEAGKPIDFATLQRVKREQREALKNGNTKPERGKGKTTVRKEVRKSDKSSVQGLADSEES